ncbi:glycosyltransferase, partial [Vibrio anguillarum]|nr:glycosyltransferase [Vibrio anguillarum]
LFVSTSQQEPFGLSILEALAAGMCVIIPEDNAYWDSLLTHELNCLKYAANDVSSLAETLHRAITEPHLAQRL